MMTVLAQKMNDFIIHSWRTKPCLNFYFLVGLFRINNFLTLFSGSSQNIRFLEVFLVGGGTSRTKRRRLMWIASVRSSPCSNLGEKLKNKIFFVDFVCCEGSKFGKIKGNVKNSKTIAFWLLTCFKLYVVYWRENECKRHKWVGDIDPLVDREPRYWVKSARTRQTIAKGG